MRDIDRWVRSHGSQLLFVYGENDPWSAEPFRLGSRTRDSAVFYERDGNHGASIEGLEAEQEAAAMRRLSRWAGVTPVKAPGSASRSSGVADDRAVRRDTALRP